MRLLVVNPNTSEAVSLRLGRRVSAVVASIDPSAQVRTATAAFGASYIADETSYAIAAHAALDAAAADIARHGEPDALLLGCFGDPGLDALRQLAGCPVVGLAGAALLEAAALGRFRIVTGGAAWAPILERLARGLGHGDALAGVVTVAPSGAQLAADPAAAVALLRAACVEAGRDVDAVVLGGAGLAGLAEPIAGALAVPLIDSVAAGARALHRAAGAVPGTRAHDAAGTDAMPRAAWQGLSLPLLARLR